MTEDKPQQQDSIVLDMIRYFDKWAPFGGGDDEIFPTFGVVPSVFYSRLAQAFRTQPALLAGRDARQTIAYCTCKAGAAAGTLQ